MNRFHVAHGGRSQALDHGLIQRSYTMAKMTLWGFDGSTYVRTVKMLLAEKKFTDF